MARLPKDATIEEFASRLKKAIGAQELGNADATNPETFGESGVAPEDEREEPDLPKVIDRQEIRKASELYLRSEGGVHTHKVVRNNKKTGQDGSHRHIFLKGEHHLILTEDDGAHSHDLDDVLADNTLKGAPHSHVIEMENGDMYVTESGGDHGHGALGTNTSGDGQHTHVLKMSDGVKLTSLTGAQFWNYWEEQKRQWAQESAEGAVTRKREEGQAKVQKMIESELYIPIFKTDDEKHLVMGIVLEPDEVDTQNDTISSDVIEEAAHKFLAKYNRNTRLGIMHNMFGEIGVELVESYVTRETTKINGNKIKKGSWVISVKVFDDLVWEKCKDGSITGFSIGGTATIV